MTAPTELPGMWEAADFIDTSETSLTYSEKVDAILANTRQTAADIAAIRVMVAEAVEKVEPVMAKLSKSPVLSMLGIKL